MSAPSDRVQVRRLQIGDYEPWRHFWRRYLAFYEAQLPDEVYEVNWSRLFDRREPVAGFLALVERRPAGLAHALTHRSFWTSDDYCYLQDLYVDPAHRSSGVGRALVEAVRAFASERECARVYWLTQETNTSAMMLYDKIAERTGFIQYVLNSAEMHAQGDVSDK